MKRFQQFANSPHVNDDLEKLFTLIALTARSEMATRT